MSKRKKPNVIRFVNYRKHVDYENYCRENLLLYVPFENNEHSLKQCHSTWQVAYTFNEQTIQMNEAKFTYDINPLWGDLDNEMEQIDSSTIKKL